MDTEERELIQKEAEDFEDYEPIKIKEERAIYRGEATSGRREGMGMQIWKNGAVYIGEWSSNKMNGEGRLLFVLIDLIWNSVFNYMI